MNRFSIWIASLITIALPIPLWTQTNDPSLLTLERIFASREFGQEFFGPARWLEDGSGYTTLEWSRRGVRGRNVVRHNPETGERSVLVPVTQLIPPGANAPLWMADYSWSSDGKRLLIFTNTQRVWRLNTRGDYWVLDMETGKLKRLGGSAEPSSLLFAKFSPDGSQVGYVHHNNIYVEDLEGGRIIQLTTDGSETLINGTSDWVNEEEFFLRDGFRWSPDGKRIAYWQFDIEGVREFTMINNTDSLYPQLITFPYPKAGEMNSAVRVGVVGADAGSNVWLDIEGDPRQRYIPRLDWTPDSREVVIQRLNRLQNTNSLMLGDPATGAVRTLLTETDDAWLDPVDDLRWVDGGSHFTWLSERDGWRRLYTVARPDGEARVITRGNFDVINVQSINGVNSIQHLDEAEGWIYFIASPDDATQRYLYRTRLDGSGEAERLTPEDQPGNHSYRISPDSRWAFHTYSRYGVPPTIELIRLPSHEAVRTLVDNAELRAAVEALRKTPVEFFRVDVGDGLVLDGWQMKPFDFDPSQKYPVLFYVYGEPWSQTVRDAWTGRRYLWHLMLTQRGYIVMSIDNRGTPAPRGRDWRKVVYRKIGVIASQDQAAAVRAIGAWPYVDPDRIAIWGWSGGGSMSLNVIFRHPDLYDTAMAVAPVPDIRLYDTIYQERYMGLPQENPDDYRLASPVTFAPQLKGNLLIVHGTGDDNVHYQGTERLINALVEANKPFTMMAYPNRSHGIFEGRGTTLHLYSLLTNYLSEHMPPGPRAMASE